MKRLGKGMAVLFAAAAPRIPVIGMTVTKAAPRHGKNTGRPQSGRVPGVES